MNGMPLFHTMDMKNDKDLSIEKHIEMLIKEQRASLIFYHKLLKYWKQHSCSRIIFDHRNHQYSKKRKIQFPFSLSKKAHYKDFDI